MGATISVAIEPLIKRKIFGTEDAIRELTQEYVLRQIAGLRRKVGRLELKYSMRFQQCFEMQNGHIQGGKDLRRSVLPTCIRL